MKDDQVVKPKGEPEPAWWVCRMHEADTLLTEEKARRLRQMTQRESFAIFRSLCEAGQLPPGPERDPLEAVRMAAMIRVRTALNKLGHGE
jgi:hypothetical protein